jgi:hypothetical protein
VVEPVFANICSAHRLRRFTLRGRQKVTPCGCSTVWCMTSARCSDTGQSRQPSSEGNENSADLAYSRPHHRRHSLNTKRIDASRQC